MRIGINVPNELIQRIKAVQPDVNVSQICREAIQNLAKRHERVEDWLANDGSIQRVLEFAKEHEELYREPDWEVLALEDAREWVSTIPKDGWDRFLYDVEFLERQGRTDFEGLVMGNHYHWNEKGFYFHRNKNSEWQERIYQKEEKFGVSTGFGSEAKEIFERAWVAYVTEVRRQYLEYLKEIKEQTLNQRKQALESQPSPEMPEGLFRNLNK